MKAKDYRAQLEAELAAERFEEEQVLELVEVHQILANKSSTTATRASALGRCEFGDDEFDEWVSTCLSVLNDESERVAVRMAALDQLKWSSWLSYSNRTTRLFARAYNALHYRRAQQCGSVHWNI